MAARALSPARKPRTGCPRLEGRLPPPPTEQPFQHGRVALFYASGGVERGAACRAISEAEAHGCAESCGAGPGGRGQDVRGRKGRLPPPPTEQPFQHGRVALFYASGGVERESAPLVARIAEGDSRTSTNVSLLKDKFQVSYFFTKMLTVSVQNARRIPMTSPRGGASSLYFVRLRGVDHGPRQPSLRESCESFQIRPDYIRDSIDLGAGPELVLVAERREGGDRAKRHRGISGRDHFDFIPTLFANLCSGPGRARTSA